MAAAILSLAEGGWGNHIGDWGAGWWILMAAMMVIFWGLVIVGVVWLVQSEIGHRSHRHSALEVLEHRLASGDITPDEYRRRREALEGGAGGNEEERQGAPRREP
jgi:uncharacterized membrane protein